ncbi:hypothetical protein [Paracoccus aminovorans]|uniref:hypothetical protein n=1 Tax=Paracoccus aminovorans TaxID=34004 RepID=UPI002B2587B9|nr:hypothetical protein [Paracoccus aminovorans]
MLVGIAPWPIMTEAHATNFHVEIQAMQISSAATALALLTGQKPASEGGADIAALATDTSKQTHPGLAQRRLRALLSALAHPAMKTLRAISRWSQCLNSLPPKTRN